jgi:hypothetical protein
MGEDGMRQHTTRSYAAGGRGRCNVEEMVKEASGEHRACRRSRQGKAGTRLHTNPSRLLSPLWRLHSPAFSTYLLHHSNHCLRWLKVSRSRYVLHLAGNECL